MVPQFPFSGAKPHFLEFNHVYQAWHSLLPDTLHLQGEPVPLTSLMWSPHFFQNTSLAQIALAFSQTPIARYGPHNFPPFVRGITEQALADERAQRLPSYNAYRSYVGLPPLQSFDELAVDNPQQLQQLYHGDVNRLEFLTGIVADSHARLPGNLLGDVQLILVSLFAVQDVASNAILQNPMLWSDDYLTKAGKDFVEQFEFRTLLQTLLAPEHGDDVDRPCPFQTDASTCMEPKDWRLPDQVGTSLFRMDTVCSNVGVDYTSWYYYDNGYMRITVAIYTVRFEWWDDTKERTVGLLLLTLFFVCVGRSRHALQLLLVSTLPSFGVCPISNRFKNHPDQCNQLPCTLVPSH